jgi:hypothetical protein
VRHRLVSGGPTNRKLTLSVWQPYKVDIARTADNDLNATLKATSELETLRKSAPVGPFGLIGRARGDLERRVGERRVFSRMTISTSIHRTTPPPILAGARNSPHPTGFPQDFVIVGDDDSPWAVQLRWRRLEAADDEADQKQHFAPGSPSFSAAAATAHGALRVAGCEAGLDAAIPKQSNRLVAGVFSEDCADPHAQCKNRFPPRLPSPPMPLPPP